MSKILSIPKLDDSVSMARYGIERSRMAYDLDHNEGLLTGDYGPYYLARFQALEALTLAAGLLRGPDALLICAGTTNGFLGDIADSATE